MDIALLTAKFEQQYGYSNHEIKYFFAPGRVNLIGEYTDINGGFVFPAAVSLGIWGAIRTRNDNIIQLKSATMKLEIKLDLTKPLTYRAEEGWVNYPKGVIRYLTDSGYKLAGSDIMFAADLPDGAGLSSSAAILVLTAYMLQSAANGHGVDRLKLAQKCQKIENDFINMNCGIMDHFAIAMGRQDYAMLLDCNTLQFEHVPLVLDNYSLVIMNTNKKRELTESKYNERRRECDEALAIINRYRKVDNLCQASLADVEAYIKDNVLRRRAKHAVTENARVLEAVELLKQGNILSFGSCMTASHLSLKEDFEVSGAELDTIVECALAASGCIGARMTGAGFGGCAIALVENNRLDEFKFVVGAQYHSITGRTADFYPTVVADGVKQL